MIHLHWYTFATLALIVFSAGLLAMAVIKGEQVDRMCAKLVAAWAERDRLQLATDYQDKAIEALRDELVERDAELVILRNSVTGPTEAA